MTLSIMAHSDVTANRRSLPQRCSAPDGKNAITTSQDIAPESAPAAALGHIQHPYNPNWSWPVSPKENRLAVAIRAGRSYVETVGTGSRRHQQPFDYYFWSHSALSRARRAAGGAPGYEWAGGIARKIGVLAVGSPRRSPGS